MVTITNGASHWGRKARLGEYPAVPVRMNGFQMTIEINPHLIIPESELKFSASRSQGPGGQHVNKVNSRVNLEFNVKHSLKSPILGTF